jgi:hypothetical protein
MPTNNDLKKIICQLYIQGKTIRQISTILRLNFWTIRSNLNKDVISNQKARKATFLKWKWAEIKAKYNLGTKPSILAKDYGYSVSMIWKIIKT